MTGIMDGFGWALLMLVIFGVAIGSCGTRLCSYVDDRVDVNVEWAPSQPEESE